MEKLLNWFEVILVCVSFKYSTLNTSRETFILLLRIKLLIFYYLGPIDSDGKESAYNAGDCGLIPRLGRSCGEVNDYPLQYSCPENSMDRGAWWSIVHRVTKSQTQLTEQLTHI